MVRPIVRDIFLLGRKAEPATHGDLQVGIDLQDTLNANRDRCVGMAANMIGIPKAVIIVNMGPADLIMYNPKITERSGPYETEEGCLSLDGVRKTTRYRQITVQYLDPQWKQRQIRLEGWPAQIAQHEIDHLEGKLI